MMDKNGAFLLLVVVLSMTLMVAGCGMLDKSANTTPQYPSKPITMIVPVAAGGSMDMMARAIEKLMMKHLGQPLVVTNIPGGACKIGWNELAGSKSDGYTIGIVANGVILQTLYGETRYHYPTALEPLALINPIPIVVAVRAEQPWESINDLVAYAKQHPGELKFSHAALGGTPHVVGEIFAKEADIKLNQVPFRGESEALAALLGGHVQVLFATAAIKEHVKSGKVKILAIAESQRMNDPVFKHVPTFKEQGLNVELSFWQGIGAPKGLPADVKTRLTNGLRDIVNEPEFKKHMEELGMTVEYLGPQEFGEKWVEENARMTKVIKETGIAELIAAQKK